MITGLISSISTIFFRGLCLLWLTALLMACGEDNETKYIFVGDDADDYYVRLSLNEMSSSAVYNMHVISSLPATYEVQSVSYSARQVTQNSESLESALIKKSSHHDKVHRYHFPLPGDYIVEVKLDAYDTLTGETVTFTDEVTVEVDAKTWRVPSLEDSSSCTFSCTADYAGNANKVMCESYDDSVSDESVCTTVMSVSLDELLTSAQVESGNFSDDDIELCLRAVGAPGADPNDTLGGGTAGGGGVSQTMMSYLDLIDQSDTLYFLVGTSGASSIVALADFTDYDNWAYSEIALIGAGGGGAGDSTGEDQSLQLTGGDGGDGALVSIYYQEDEGEVYKCAFGQGEDGGKSYMTDGSGFERGGYGGGSSDGDDNLFLLEADCDNDVTVYQYAAGGTTSFLSATTRKDCTDDNGNASNCITQNDGLDGFGGLSALSLNYDSDYGLTYNSDADASWLNDSTFSDNYPNFDSASNSGSGSTGIRQYSANAGNGGGGAGGGAGGAYSTGGGGGGGFGRSYATSATEEANWCEDRFYVAQSSNDEGKVQVIFYNQDAD